MTQPRQGSETRRQGFFFRVPRFPPLLHRFNDSANKIKLLNSVPPLLDRLFLSASRIKLKINVIPTLSNLIAELSFHPTWHVT